MPSQSRRQFLGVTSLGVAGLLRGPASVRGAESRGAESPGLRRGTFPAIRITGIEAHEVRIPYHDPDRSGSTDNLRNLHPPHVPGPAPGYANAVATDFWAEESSAAFERTWKRAESGPVWDRGE